MALREFGPRLSEEIDTWLDFWPIDAQPNEVLQTWDVRVPWVSRLRSKCFAKSGAHQVNDCRYSSFVSGDLNGPHRVRFSTAFAREGFKIKRRIGSDGDVRNGADS